MQGRRERINVTETLDNVQLSHSEGVINSEFVEEEFARDLEEWRGFQQSETEKIF